MKTKMFRILVLLALAFSALTPAATARASAIGCSWNGSVDANWSTPGNWNVGCSGAGGIPGAGDTLTFPLGASNTVMTDDLPAISLQGLTFSGALNYTLNGANTISLTGGMDVQAGDQMINAPLAVSNAGVIFHAANATNLAIGGTLSLGTNDLSLTVDSAAGVTGMQISNTVTGSGAAKLTKTGSGNLQIIGDTHLSIFDVDVNSGSLSLGPNPGGAWSGLPWNKKLTLALGTSLNLSSHAVIGSIAGAGNINKGSYLLQFRQMQTTTFTGDISGSNQLTIIGNGAGVLTIDRAGGTLSHTGDMNINTSGILKLVNTTATAPVPGFSVTSGTLELNNSHVGAINLGYSGGGFNYDGTLILSGSTASIASQITLVNNSRITSVINSTTDYGRIAVTSPVDLGAGAPTFTLQGSYAPNLGETFNIIQNTNAGTATKNNATFSGLAQGGAVSFNARSMAADYQAGGNTTFALTAMTDNISPTVASIVRKSYNSPTPYSSVDFTVTFSESVTGVDVADFSVTTSGIAGAGVISVSGSGSVYTVFVDTGTGDGTLRLDVPLTAAVTDLVGNPISGLPFTSGQVYEIDKTAPTILSITRLDPTPTAAASVDFMVTFSEPVTGVDTAGPTFNDFTLTTSAGISGASVTGVSGGPTTYTVTVNTGSGNGTLRLNVVPGGSIVDAALNPLAAGFTTGQIYSVIKTVTFADVSASYWAYSYIERLYIAGITGGCGASPLIYCPDSTVTRAQMAIFLLRGMHGSAYTPPAVGGSTGFNDVAPTDFAAAWIKQLALEGITGGCGPSLYCPNATVTRAQMAIFLLRGEHDSGYTPPDVGGSTGFNDVAPTDFAAAWIKQLAAESITGGCGPSLYCPAESVTRAEMAIFLVRTFNLP